MRDLQIWRTLQAEDSSEQALASALAELAAAELEIRVPFFARLAALVEHADPKLRAAALRGLGGARGALGLRALVAGLDDEHAEVRTAAFEGLRASVDEGHEPRWIHALMARDPKLRAEAVARVPRAVEHYCAYLRPDPAAGALARRVALPKGSLRLALELHAGELADDGELARALELEARDAVEGLLVHGLRRDGEQLEAQREWLLTGGPEPPASDRGEDVLDTLVRAIGAAGGPLAATRLNAFTSDERAPAGLADRLIVAVARAAADPDASLREDQLAHALRLEPRLLASPVIAIDRRRAAARVFGQGPRRRSRKDRKLAEALLGSALVAEGGEAPRLEIAAGLSHLLRRRKLETVVAVLGRARVREGLADAAGFDALCSLPVEQRRPLILELVDELPAARRPRCWALALLRWSERAKNPRAERSPADVLLAERSEAELLAIAGALAELAASEHELPVADVRDNKRGDRACARLIAAMEEGLRPRAPAAVLGALLGREAGALARILFSKLLGVLAPPALALAFAGLAKDRALRLCALLEDELNLPAAVEAPLLALLAGHGSSLIRERAKAMTRATRADAPTRAQIREVHSFSEAELQAIVAARDPAALERALARALAAPTRGLAGALAQREAEPGERPACVALLAAHDDAKLVAAEFERRWDHEDEGFESALIGAAVELWQGNPALPAHGHGFLHNWQVHAFAFGDWMLAHAGGPRAALLECVELPCPILRQRCWAAAAYALQLWHFRAREHLAELREDEGAELLALAVDQLDTELGPAAAKLLVTLHLHGGWEPELAALEARVLMLAPDLDDVTRHGLSRWLRIDGLPARSSAARAATGPIRGDLLGRLRGSEDLDELAEACTNSRSVVVHEAVLRLLELGEAGEQRLCLLLAEDPPPTRVEVIVTSVALWTSEACVADLRALAEDGSVRPKLRFRLALALGERGEDLFVPALAAAREPAGPRNRAGWFEARDWAQLAGRLGELALALELADSPHPHAYQHAITTLLARPVEDATILPALRAFLEAGGRRPSHLRRKAAYRLLRHGDERGLPVLFAAVADRRNNAPERRWMEWLTPASQAWVIREYVELAIVAGDGRVPESRALQLVDRLGPGARAALPADAEAESLGRLLLWGSDAKLRERLSRRCSSAGDRRRALGELAEIFAWGVRRGLELTGRRFRIHMTERREELGFTYSGQDRIFVSAVPALARERHGKAIVEGLILHEFGHHVHHHGPEAEAIWDRAAKAGLHGVLNLVADEHLERNLRALRADYGDRLKRLGAYAFLHAERELKVEWLLDILGARAFAALSARALQPGFEADCVRVHRGSLLRELEAQGSAWARFARALRMGLGDRHGDPRVAVALALFPRSFRHLDMAGLWQVTLRLVEIFAGELPMAELFGGQETLGGDERGAAISGRGLSDDELQDEVTRILEPPATARAGGGSEGPPSLSINVSGEQDFERIHHIERLTPDPAAHRAVARELGRHADRLRRFLHDLGLALVPRRARLRGRAFDRTRTQAVVLRRDPRMLVARELEVHSDLFIGVAVDCSSSMSIRDHMDKARHFAILIAEAVRGLAGVDARFFGFTDSQLYDAGDAERCAVTSLATGGGNNDAAALAHLAAVAEQSRRRAKLLVMISDGLPTQCSVEALRGLVDTLTRRRGMICAQVAVRPLEEVCFPHYVSLHAEALELATHRFGVLISKLARQALGR